ncbi:MAG: glycosyltransferase family 9 protein, partial [Brevundimonas sp.]|nr:glycosyltransferase family 9 protein [Brevundimonas sp.]
MPKVLFVTSNRIGDCVISSGVIREIARQVPGARITVACGRPPAPFFRAAPGVERVIILDKKRFSGHWFELWKEVVGDRWDMVIDIRGSALAWLLRARRRVIYHGGWEAGLPKVETVSRGMGAASPLAPELFIDEQARADAAAVMQPQLATGPGPGPVLALAPI